MGLHNLQLTRLHILLKHGLRPRLDRRIRVHSSGAVTLNPHMALPIRVELLALAHVQVDGEAPRDDEEGERHDHGVPGAGAIRHVAQDGGDDGAAADGGDEVRRAALGVAAEAAQSESEDGGEADLRCRYGQFSDKFIVARMPRALSRKGCLAQEAPLTLSKHSTNINIATLVFPCVSTAARPKTKHSAR